jgi:hypothetical protein
MQKMQAHYNHLAGHAMEHWSVLGIKDIKKMCINGQGGADPGHPFAVAIMDLAARVGS